MTRGKGPKSNAQAAVKAAREGQLINRLQTEIHNLKVAAARSSGRTRGLDSAAGYKALPPGDVAISDAVQFAGQSDPREAEGVIDAAFKNRVWRSLGSTDDGRNWAFAALNPCTESLQIPIGIPDQSQFPSVTPGFRNSSIIQAPSTGGPSGQVWDVQIIFVPFPEVDYLWRWRNSSDEPWNAWTAINPAGLTPNADGSANTLRTQGYDSYRMQARGYTVHFNAPALSNQGVVYAGQVPGLNAYGRQLDVGVAPTSPEPSPIYSVVSVPSTSQALQQMDHLSVEWEAKHGIYMPLRFRDPTSNFVTCAAGGVLTYAGDTALPSTLYFITSDGEQAPQSADTITQNPAPTFTQPAGAPVPTKFGYGASFPCNQTTGVIIFQGISVSSSLAVKSRMFVQGSIGPGVNALQPFVHSPPFLDSTAIDAVARVGQTQKHAYWSRCNDTGSILRNIGNVSFTFGKWAAAGVANEIPVVGRVVGDNILRIKSPWSKTKGVIHLSKYN